MGVHIPSQLYEVQAILAMQRGEDPFAVTTQLRTLWA
jgi:hypothetical protein